MSAEIEPFHLSIPQQDLDDLVSRLRNTRWPEPEPAEGWTQGVPIEPLRALVDYWRDEYDWRRCEALMNSWDQYRTRIEGLDIHFVHIRSPHADAMPLLLTHGWPGSVLEFHKAFGPLADPAGHGGDAADAFHIVAPSLPGFGFSGKPDTPGWGVARIANAWHELMQRLGYRRYVAQGGDWGSSVTVRLGTQAPEGLAGVHLNMLTVMPDDLGKDLDEEEQAAVDLQNHFLNVESAYARLQGTRPQTIGYALADSPVGQAAWIYEKLRGWSDCNGDPETIFTRDEILDAIMMYWLTNSGASSARLYWESMGSFRPVRIDLPLGYSAFPKEITRAPRKWADRMFSNIIHWNELERGGHFAAFEQPELFVRELRDCFRTLR